MAKSEEKIIANKTILMTRNDEEYPQGPHMADVHPDEVEQMKKHGWKIKGKAE